MDTDSHELKFAALTTFSEDDPAAAAKILRTFVSETRNNRDALQTALDASDAKHLTGLAHKMLPLFRMINATRCVQFLAWLEAHRDEAFSADMQEKAIFALEEIDKVIVQCEKFSGLC